MRKSHFFKNCGTFCFDLYWKYVPQFWKNRDSRNCLLKMNGLYILSWFITWSNQVVCWCFLELEKRACSFKCAIVYILQPINSLEHSVSVPGCTSTFTSLFKILWALQYIELFAFNVIGTRGSWEQINMPVNYVCL